VACQSGGTGFLPGFFQQFAYGFSCIHKKAAPFLKMGAKNAIHRFVCLLNSVLCGYTISILYFYIFQSLENKGFFSFEHK